MSRKNVLFIGNSYTHCNNLPDMVQQISAGAGEDINTDMVTAGGKSLSWHLYRNPGSIDRITQGDWDVVVLQDHSLQTIEQPDTFHRSVSELSKIIHSTGAAPVLYMTWARKHLPEKQQVITEEYVKAAKENNIDVVPVGIAWQKALKNDPTIELHTEDNSHPSLLGSYAAACVFFGVICNKPVSGLTAQIHLSQGVDAVFDSKKAAFLQDMAHQAVHDLHWSPEQ